MRLLRRALARDAARASRATLVARGRASRVVPAPSRRRRPERDGLARDRARPSRSLAIAALAVAVLALAREVGELRLALAAAAGRSRSTGGPAASAAASRCIERFAASSRDALRARRLLLRRLPDVPGARAGGRRACSAIRCSPSRSSTRCADADVWRALAIPGSPYAVALTRDGTVLAKGTFNSARQLESVLATGRARARAELAPCLSRRRLSDGPRRARTSRRGFLARVGGGCSRSPPAAGRARAPVEPDDADAYHFCGHTYTTGSCPHPTGLPRVDAHGYPLRAARRPAGRRPRPARRPPRPPVDEHGRRLVDPDGRPLPPAPRTPRLPGRGRRAVTASRTRDRRLLVPLLRRPRAPARWTAARYHADAHQRRRRADRLLLRAAARSSASCTTRPKVPC